VLLCRSKGCIALLGDNLYPHIPIGGGMASCDDPATEAPSSLLLDGAVVEVMGCSYSQPLYDHGDGGWIFSMAT
ncbi:hypothetical protein A2U01_0103755, partial [Trifolium medium]|nr:hypothetical protein [Trifolium medium]